MSSSADRREQFRNFAKRHVGLSVPPPIIPCLPRHSPHWTEHSLKLPTRRTVSPEPPKLCPPIQLISRESKHGYSTFVRLRASTAWSRTSLLRLARRCASNWRRSKIGWGALKNSIAAS